jgi:hypothetical protein
MIVKKVKHLAQIHNHGSQIIGLLDASASYLEQDTDFFYFNAGYK